MATYKFLITQTNEFEVTIEADNEDLALAEYNEMLTDDFGEPVNSCLDYEVVEVK